MKLGKSANQSLWKDKFKINFYIHNRFLIVPVAYLFLGSYKGFYFSFQKDSSIKSLIMTSICAKLVYLEKPYVLKRTEEFSLYMDLYCLCLKLQELLPIW